MYPNLEGELRKKKITRQKMADDFKCNVSTISQKLTKNGRLKLNEAYQIRNQYCPELSIEYLFEWQDEAKTA